MVQKPVVFTIREAFQKASSFFSSTWEAEWLLRQLLDMDRARFFTEWNQPFPPDQLEQWNLWVQRRRKGEPIQYIVGEQAFYGRPFHVTPAVLIPRPETEELIEIVLKEAEIEWGEQRISVVDVGTGSGCIAITLALERNNWEITAIDLSSAALEIANTNARNHQVLDRIQFREGSYLEPLLQDLQSFHILISNPPYIPSAKISTLEREVADYEPRVALDGGENGMMPYHVMMKQLGQLNPEQCLIVWEIGAEQGENLQTWITGFPMIKRAEVRKDVQGRDRFLLGWWKRP